MPVLRGWNPSAALPGAHSERLRHRACLRRVPVWVAAGRVPLSSEEGHSRCRPAPPGNSAFIGAVRSIHVNSAADLCRPGLSYVVSHPGTSPIPHFAFYCGADSEFLPDHRLRAEEAEPTRL